MTISKRCRCTIPCSCNNSAILQFIIRVIKIAVATFYLGGSSSTTRKRNTRKVEARPLRFTLDKSFSLQIILLKL